ncbi:MAG: dihydroorotase [Candidatus Kapabacteria bacterium]|nr:dihydroorotase [Candidatus Kapabacteria bacterium]
MNILFNNILAINPIQNLNERINLHIIDGVINNCSSDSVITHQDTQIIDASDFVAAPGFFDMHVHFREPGYEYKEDIHTGCLAAANGGFTGVLVMPNTMPAIDNAPVIGYIQGKAKDNLVDVHVSGALSQNRDGKAMSPMLELADCGALMFTDDGSCVSNSELMRRIFRYASSKDLLISQHCEDHGITHGFAMNESPVSDILGLKGYPALAEELILYRDIILAADAGNRRYHASHLSTKGTIEIIRDAKRKGLRVTCEVTPHHFSLNDNLLTSYDTNLKMNPPLRRQVDIDAIIEAIIDGTVDCIASDHAPHSIHEKEVEFDNAPYGIIGLETEIGVTSSILLSNKSISLNRFIELLSINPRKLLGLPDIFIKNDNIANLTIFSPNEEWVVDKRKFKSKSTNSPYIGKTLKGKPKFAINNKKIFESTL